MKTSALFVSFYAFVVAAGGCIGCFIAGSTPSLVAGLLFGILILINALRMFKGSIRGQQIALIQAITLGSFFVYRYQTTGKVMPALPMITLSFFMAAFLLLRMPRKRVPGL